MQTTVLYVKNMVCHRCILAVTDVLINLDIPFEQVGIGEIRLPNACSKEQYDMLGHSLSKIGLELIGNKMNGLVERIKQLVLTYARLEGDSNEHKVKLSVLLADQLNYEYTYLSRLFSSIEGRTIEHYFIEQRIEKVKELLVYNELTLSEIAFEMEYSSASHLSNQFKKITGLTPSHFKRVGLNKRKLLDQV